jgi:hypothetical protein
MKHSWVFSAILVLTACNGSDHSKLEGVYSGASTLRSANFPPQPPSVFPLAGAVASDGSGYFVTTGSPASAFLVFRNLWHTGTDQLLLGSAKDGPNPVQVTVTAIPSGYKFSWFTSLVDGSDELSFQSDPVTKDPKPMAELAGNYQGTDMVQNTFATATLDAQGNLKGTEGLGCDITAQLSQVDGENLYDVTFQYSGGAHCHFSMQGVAWVGDTDLSGQTLVKGTYLNLIAFDDPDQVGVGMTLKLQ